MFHQDAIPFLLLAVFATITSGLALALGSKAVFALSLSAGLIPLISYVSIAERWSTPSMIETAGIFSAPALLAVGMFMSSQLSPLRGPKQVTFWVFGVLSLLSAIVITLWTYLLGQIPS